MYTEGVSFRIFEVSCDAQQFRISAWSVSVPFQGQFQLQLGQTDLSDLLERLERFLRSSRRALRTLDTLKTLNVPTVLLLLILRMNRFDVS